MHDVAIIGGGPAGTACAIALRQTFPSLRVVVVEASGYTQPRAGEVLPPSARSLLQHLGVLHQMQPVLSSTGHGIASAWGSPQLEETDYFTNLAGEALHLERNRFDALLASRAEELSVTVLRNTSLRMPHREHNLWHLQLSTDAVMQTRWVVDATGRTAAFARTQGVPLHQQDSLVAFSRFFQLQARTEARTLVESTPHGWWYTAPLPSHRRVVTFFADADIARDLHVAEPAAWLDLLAATHHIHPLIHHAVAEPTPLTRSAATSTLGTPYGEGWLAAGDSAAACDPLSGQGITSALRSGILAAYATGDTLLHNHPLALTRYAAILATQRASYTRTRAHHYAREQRWSAHPFWSRRHAAVPEQRSHATRLPLTATHAT